jgi:hypothetical protein
MAVALGGAVSAAPAADAAVAIGASGTIGYVHGIGATVCNPFVSGGFARRYVEIGSPLVEDTNPVYRPDVAVIGGGQDVYWQGWLQKYVGHRWVTVWASSWIRDNGTYGALNNFGSAFVNVYTDVRRGYRGAGYYRSGGTLWWQADGSHPGGWVQYRHTRGNYFVDGYAHQAGAGATPISTPWCHIR